MPRVLFLVSGVHEASCRFRVLQYVPHLRVRGIEVEVADLHVPWRVRHALLTSAAAFDTVVIHRAWLSPRELRLLRRLGRCVVFDFDDAIMLRATSRRRFQSWQRRRRFARMVRAADVVVAGNAYLASWARRYTPTVTVIPTVVDLAEYPARPTSDGVPVVGWIGTHSNLIYLHQLAAALRALAARLPDVQVKVVSDAPAAIPGVDVLNKPWIRREEITDLRSFRVGIMPLPDDPWTRGKCGVKILQYFAAGIPVVCSPVGVNRELVCDGENGYLARNEDEWVARLSTLLDDRATGARLAAAGRTTVERAYCIAATIDHMVEVLRQARSRSLTSG